MQFHLNGFRTGDPGVSEATADASGSRQQEQLQEEVDVLIVGCGPAGLALAAQLAAFPEIKTRIVEQQSGPLLVGQADGVACRTMEMFHAYGFCDRVLKEAYWVNETTFWKPNESNLKEIIRSRRIQDTEDGLSEFPHVILNQARVHDFFLDVMRHSPSRLEPDYSRRLVDLIINATGKNGEASHPVTVTLERVDAGHEGRTEAIRARYVVGCDGARSTVRTALGRVLHGDSANQAWGVMDILAVTDFPDIRLKSVIHSAHEGSVLIIPREGGYMVRLYIELDKLNENERVSSKNITADHLIAAAQRIIQPYKLGVKEIAWWSVYEIAQGLCDKFDDVPAGEEASRYPHVFITGDACHTHSPKAGQGMNVSMRDSFNLGWKLASVLQGQCAPPILHTYSAERQAVAKELIDFDREFAKMFSAPPKISGDEEDEGVDPAEFQNYFVRHGRFTAGTATRYGPSIISAAPTHQHLASGFIIGMRFHSAPVIRLTDAKPVHLGHTVQADGRWRLFAFSGAEDPAGPASGVRGLCDYLADSADSPVRRHTPPGADIDSVIDVRAVYQQGHRDLAVEAMPGFLLPQKGRYGLRDYEKMFCPDQNTGQNIFDMRGIDRDNGCMVVVRPDQHVANVLPLNAYAALTAFFDCFIMREMPRTRHPGARQ
ncbi:MAG: 3-hydroxybenzoate 4-monooxygenase [Rhodospirillaceae bacterium]|jgi:phenol 2-monooxygenase|nr:3-hydroxybenzoate 4-monooxygenase [Rhodospirillaceae bacterium]